MSGQVRCLRRAEKNHPCPTQNSRQMHRKIVKKLIKGTVARDFLPLIFLWIDPIWAPDSHSKIFSNSVSNSRRHSYSKVKIRESVLSDTALIHEYSADSIFKFQKWCLVLKNIIIIISFSIICVKGHLNIKYKNKNPYLSVPYTRKGVWDAP